MVTGGFDLFLFVPADRPERYAKAAQAGADAIIIDLEDAVAADGKDAARTILAEALPGLRGECRILVRVNGIATPWHAADLALLGNWPGIGIMLPKAENPADLTPLRQLAGPLREVVALVESPLGMANARALAEAADRLAFGTVDYAASLTMAHTRNALLAGRSELVLASALAGKPAPIDGVTTSLGEDATFDDAAHAIELGFGGKLLIHPRQIAPAIRGAAPQADAAEKARRIVDSAGAGARSVDGAMVDAPVVLAARQVLRRAEEAAARLERLGAI